MTDTVILPVGMALGPYYDPNSTSGEPDRWDIGWADEVESLTRDEYTVWSAVRLDTKRAGRLEVDRAALAEIARTKGRIADPAPIIAKLFELGLLVEWTVTGGVPAALTRQLKSLRLIPTGDALGNDPKRREVYLIGKNGKRAVDVPIDVYTLWSYSHNIGSMWDGCADLTEPEEGGAPPNTTMDEATGLLAEYVPLLVLADCAVLERVK